MARQLPLDLPHVPGLGRDDFLVSPSNESAYALLERWPDWPDPVLLLIGPPGSGKTHLAAIWAAEAEARILPASAIRDEDEPDPLASGALVIEGADRAPRDEASLFHLLNRARERGAFVLLTGDAPVESWGLRTPDLISRLRLAPAIRLDPPDDALLKSVLVKLFLDRQLVVDTSVVDYVAARIERSLERAARVVEAMDREALSRGRRITRAMAAELLRDRPDLAEDPG